MSRRIIRAIGMTSGFHPKLALILVAIVTVVAGLLAYKRLRIEMDVAALLPRGSELLAEKENAEWLFGDNYDFLFCVLEIKEDAPEEIRQNTSAYLKRTKSEIEPALSDDRYFKKKRYDSTQGRHLFQDNPAAQVALLDTTDFDRLDAGLVLGGLDRTVESIAQRIADDPTSNTEFRLREDPFGLESMLNRRSQFLAGPLKNLWKDGYYISGDEQMLLFVMWPAKPSTNLVTARELLLFVEQTREAIYARNPEWRGWLKIDFIGPHMENAEGTSDVREDMLLTSAVSFIAVLFLFVVAFRQPEALIFVAIPLVVGVIWSLGFASLFVNRITQVTLTFAAILIGLGIDFSIHLYNRYLEYIRLGRGVQSSLAHAIYGTGPSIFAGAITTFFGFFAMLLTDFEGFRELGMFGGIGILMCLLAVFLCLPPLMVLLSGFSRKARGPLATLGLKTVTYTVQSYPRMTVAASLCIVVFLGYHATEAKFDDDFQTLRQPSDSYTRLQERISRHLTLPSNQVLVIVDGDTYDAALKANDTVYQNIQIMRGFTISSVDTLRSIYPSPETQLSVLQRFNNLFPPELEIETRSVAAANPRIPIDFFDAYFQRIAALREQVRGALANNREPIGLDRIDDETFRDATQNYLAHQSANDGSAYRAITRIYTAPDDGPTDNVEELFTEQLGTNLERPPEIIGNAVFTQRLRKIIVRDLTLVVLVVFFSVAIYLTWYFRSFKRAGLALIPVFFSLLCTVGVVQLLDMRLNYLNIIAIPMIIGISVDSAIHLLARFFENDERNMRLAIERTGRAIVVTGLTTIFGFGSLTLASFAGIREIGILSVVGSTAALFATLVLLPAALRLLDPRYTFAGGPGDDIG